MKAEPIVVVFEIATLDLENTLERYLALYKDRKVKIIKDFATRIRELWEKHRRKIEQTALRLHYNAIAVIPGNLNLPEFHEQMTQGYKPTWESDNFKGGGSWPGRKRFQGQITINGQQKTFDGLSVEDYLAIQAEVHSKTKCHLDTKTGTWLIRSFCGGLVPELYWDVASLCPDAYEPDYAYVILAPRPAEVFD